MEAAPHVEAISEGTQRRIEAADGVVGLCAQEHTGCSDTQHIGCSVVLSLIDLILADAFESTSAGSGKNAEFEEPRAIPAHLFRADCSHGFADGARLRPVPPARLPEHDSAFAITVHKSQGSEYREVWLPLPAAVEQLPDRTLLYTAVTRAKERFVCWNAALLAEAVHKQSRRHSALADFLRRDSQNRG